MSAEPILVTGAAGNLGRTVTRRLLASGHAVRAFDLDHAANRRALRALAHPRLEVVFGDVTREADVRGAVRGVGGVAHLAGLLPPVSERFPERTFAVNVEGTRALVAAATAERADLPFVLTSSCSVYGPSQAARGVATADSPTEGTDAYTRSKLAAEELLRASSLAYVILRVGAAIEGSAAATDDVVLRLMFEIDPAQPIELIHGEDVATAVHHALVRPEAHRRTFPLGGGPSCRMTQGEMLRSSFAMLGIRDMPPEAFGKGAYYTCWLDDAESQRILEHQAHDFAAIERDLAARFGPFKPLLRLAAPITRRYLLRYSGPLRGEPSRPTFHQLLERKP